MSHGRSLPKSPVRQAVEAALKRATAQSPMRMVDIAEHTGLGVEKVRTHVGNCVNLHLAYNINNGHRGAGLYVWGQPERAPQVERVPVMHQPVYVPPKPFYARPEGCIAYSLPSLHEGERIERKRPVLIGGAP
jgi:hypothetical protein